jgi:hypothetical protein
VLSGEPHACDRELARVQRLGLKWVESKKPSRSIAPLGGARPADRGLAARNTPSRRRGRHALPSTAPRWKIAMSCSFFLRR